VIRTQRSTLSDLLEGGGTVLTRAIEALDRVNRVLSDQNVKTFSAALADTQAVTAELRQRKELIGDLQKSIRSIDAAAQDIDAVAKSGKTLLDGDGARTMKNVAEAAEEAKAAIAKADSILAKLEGPTADFAATGLPQISAAAIQLQQTAETLDRLANDIQTNPRGAIGKPVAEEVKVKP
jgi:phospholipid/cholesterol/gamma-HCH transport system substrate-binding protein